MNPQPETKSRFFRSSESWARLSISACLAGFTIFLFYTNLGHYDDLYDSGVYLESARMMIRGGHPYTTIFDSQPPLWLPLVYGSMRLFGISFLAGQLLGATMGLIVVITSGLITWELSDWPGGWVAASIVILSPMELQWSRAVSPEVPASAFAVAGMAFAMRYIRSGNRGFLGLASGLVAASVLVKLLGLFTVPALFLAIGLRHCQTFLNNRLRWLQLIVDAALVLGVFGAVTLSTLFVFGPIRVWHQAVEFHWAARTSLVGDVTPRTTTVIAHLFAHDWLLVAALWFAIIGVVSVPEGIVLAGWIGFTFAGLLFHRPLFSHHLVVLIPPVAISAGIGWSRFWRRLLQVMDGARIQCGARGIATASLPILAGIALALGLFVMAVYQAVSQVHRIRQVAHDSADLKLAQLVSQLTTPDAAILTDAQGIAFAAGRDVPPQLSDTSFVRITSGYLTTAEVITAAEQSNVQLFLSWSGRFALLPGLIDWAGRRFPYHVSLGKGRDLYNMRELNRADYWLASSVSNDAD